jgi:hypothetical protein
VPDDTFVFNGIDGATGEYLVPPLSPAELARLAQGEVIDPAHLAELKARHRRDTEPSYAPLEGIDPRELGQTGWGVVFAHNADPGVRDALKELLEHRKGQAARTRESYYKEYTGASGYRAGDPNESKRTFLARGGAAAGMPADPEKVPYYLLLVGDPATIPYRFQYQLDVEYAVGRLWFEKAGKPDLDAFARYARSVVEAEAGKLSLPRRAVFVGVQNPDDRSTRLSATDLISPLAEKLRPERGDWAFRTLPPEQATKAGLAGVLGGPQTPALLFTASHGMGFPEGDARQLPHQGALLCQDWPGPEQWARAIPPDFYFAGDDVPDTAGLLGLLAFHFACYGAGTPALDDFAHTKLLQVRPTLAARPFVAALPQRLLGHPKGGALAVVGHVERAWSCSFHGGPTLGRQLQVFESLFRRLLDGHPVGSALEYFNQFYAALSSSLSEELADVRYGKTPDALGLSSLWTANNDARNYVVLGDPAVRLAAAAAPDAPATRPVIRVASRTAAPFPGPGPGTQPMNPPSSPPPLTPPSTPVPPAGRMERRRRLVEELQGRTLDQAYLRPDIRADLEAEAADPDPDSLITQEQLDQLRELLNGQRQAESFAAAGPVAYGFWRPDRQAVIVPGFLGSELSDTAYRGVGLIWISPLIALFDRLSMLQLARYDGGDRDLLPGVQIEATAPLPAVYDLLRLSLRLNGYAVSVHPVDWRKHVDVSADALVARLRFLSGFGQPIHLIAHSQGALAARRALQKLNEAGEKGVLDLVKHFVLLGPANFGTFSAAFAIAGSHETLDLFRRYAVSPGQGFGRVLGSMTGLYQMLPWDADRVPWLKENALGSAAFWQPAPYIDADRLERFFGWGRGIDTAFANSRTTVILGDNNGKATAAGASFSDDKLLPAAALAGDGTVTHSCSVLPGTATYLAPGTEHWRLPMYRSVINAVLALLNDTAPGLAKVSSEPADHLAPLPAVFALPTLEAPAGAPASAGRTVAAALAPVPAALRGAADLAALEQVLRTAAAVAAGTGTTVRVTLEAEPPRR